MGQERCWQIGNQLKAQRMINEKCQDLEAGSHLLLASDLGLTLLMI